MSRRWRKLVAPLILVLAAAGLVVVMRWSAPERSHLTILEGSLRDVLAPAERGITLVVSKGTGLLAAIKDYGRLQAENQALKQQVADLKAATVQMEEYRQENNRLRALLNYKTTYQQAFDFVVAPVIARNPNNWYHTLILGLGSRDGLQKDQVVVTSQGVVGRIIAVTPRTAEVLLILDREGAIGGMIQANRTPGIVEGSPDYRGYLQMVHVPRDAQIMPNQVVITSGLGGVFPRGLLLGTVIKTLPEPDGLTQRAIIAPAVDFDRLEEVLVITRIKGGINDAVSGVTGSGAGGTGPGSNPATGP
ncbi:rod shape-determining protein MreC [Neomoorella thermoacetica]|uniref:rod shape-determining protein MreC n=1 Tax=Neomoorella thermoacetica TaxID=1525 RepID=UPI0008FB972F|nr:rod shape-determining protein MreC [Moorella thermoacetica]OIQ53644.1 cell shape-determining protein MreC precursor [Moorella thermoacetica]